MSSPQFHRAQAAAHRAIAEAHDTEAERLEQSASEQHDFRPLAKLPEVANHLAAPSLRKSAAFEECARCGVIRTSSPPWRFWFARAGRWVNRRPACVANP